MKKSLVFILCLTLIYSCSEDKNQSSSSTITEEISSSSISLTNLSADNTKVKFTNTINENPSRNGLNYDYMYNGAGVALADFDNDGLDDIFFSGNDAANALYKNLGNMEFEDVSSSALPNSNKWTFGVTIVDINNDGYQDIYLCNSGPELDENKLRNELYINNGDFTFTENAKQYGLDINSHSVQAAFFDYDKDGDLDVWINNHGNSKQINDLINKTDAKNVSINGPNRLDRVNQINDNKVLRGKIKLLRRDGDKYTDVTRAAGVNTLAFGLGLSIADFNDDGHLDVYVANDFWIPDFYFINDGKGKFVNAKEKINHTSYYSMGVDAADYNNDNILDLAVVDMTPKDHYRNKTLMPSMDVQRFNVLTDVFNFTRQYMFNSLQVGMGDGNFGEIANALEVSLTDWSWAPLIFDIDNDGYNDMYVTNGYLRDTKNQDYRNRQNELRRQMKGKYTSKIAFKELLDCHSQSIDNVIYQNNNTFQYRDVTNASSNLNPTFSNGAAYGDLDNDGDLDLVISNLNQTASILQNNSKRNNYLNIKLKAKNKANILHSKLTVYSEDQVIRRDYSFTRGYLSYMSEIVSFGIGNSTAIDSLVIEWPDGTQSIFNDLEVNQTITKDFDSISDFRNNETSLPKLFKDATKLMQAYQVVHKESFFDDFKEEILLPQKYSDLGPALAIADINGDGLDDMYIGGSKGYPGKIIVLQKDKVIEVSTEIMKLHSPYEDIGATFVDANSDGLPDLYVASGGGGEISDSNLLKDRLYINTGQGLFKYAKNGLPEILSSTKSVTPIDIDNDNDMDLFVAGRNVPGKYPQKAASYLLENDNGFYKNITNSNLSGQLANMITDVTAEDVDGDGYTDLMMVGEWSTPQVFINDKNKSFNKREDANLDKLTGWWYSVSKGDFNNDGNMDYIVGNLGLNNKFHASDKKPLKVLYDDFDDNGKLDIVLTKQYNGVEVPVRGKECSSEQMPMLNKKFKTFDGFASASVEDILGKGKVKKSQSLKVTDFSSKILLSNGDGFTIKNLPFAAQWAPILDSQVLDLNNDGNLDVIIAGNMYNTEPETPSYDASRGTVLFGQGDGNFIPVTDITKTGLNLGKNVRNLGIINRDNGTNILVVANNNYTTQLYISNKRN